MSEEPVTDQEWALAARDVEDVWLAARRRSQARDLLLAIEMIIQGIAFIHARQPGAVRADLARVSTGLSLDLETLPAQGTA